jgi:hypothetical protein
MIEKHARGRSIKRLKPPRFCSRLAGKRQAGIIMLARRAMGVALSSIALAGMFSGAEARESLMICANTSSGASWPIHIDYDKSLVDGSAAKISAAEITWRDAKGNNYTLDRKSGEMTQVTASSTGGYFLHDRCKLG